MANEEELENEGRAVVLPDIPPVLFQPTILIGGVNYSNYAQIGMVYKENLTEELDSYTLILNGVPRTLFEAFEDVEIELKENEKIYMYVNTSLEEKFSCENNEYTYTYTLELISQTKLLERVQLPNLKVRARKNGTTRSISVFFNDIVLPYIQKQFQNITISSRLNALIEGKSMPEIEWATPTAKQVFNDILGTIPNNPCLVRLINNEVDYISLAEEGTELHLENVTKDEYFEQMQDFANNIVMDVKNAIPKYVNGHIITSPKAPNQAQLTDDNMELIIPNAKLESVNSVKVKNVQLFFINSPEGNFNTDVMDLDITPMVVEESVYNGLKVKGDEYENSKKNHLYFKQGDNKIVGVNAYSGAFKAGAIKEAIIYTANKIATQYDATLAETSINGKNIFDGGNSVRNYIFEIDYVTAVDSRVKVVKEKPEAKDCTFYQQQNQSAIDMKALMRNQRETVNRLGNELYVMDAIITDGVIPSLNDFVIKGDDKYYLAQKEVAEYGSYQLFKGTFSKDYIKKSAYYGLTSRKRYTQLAQANESVVREEHTRYIVSIGTDIPIYGDNADILLQYRSLNQHFAKFFVPTENDLSLKVLGMTTEGTQTAVTLFPSIISGDKSVFVSAQCEDNYSVGMYISDPDNKMQDYATYVDENGEMEIFNIFFFSSIYEPFKNDISKIEQIPNISIGDNDFFQDLSHKYLKDNGETLKVTYQFDFVKSSENDSVFIGEGIGKNNSLTMSGNKNCKWKYHPTRSFDKRKQSYDVSDYIEMETQPTATISTRDNIVEVHFGGFPVGSSVSSLALVNDDNELVIGMNKKNGLFVTSIYIYTKGENE